MSTSSEVDLAISGEADVGEGPFWSTDDRSITWVDITRGEVRVSSLDDNTTVVQKLPMLVGAAIPVGETSDLAVAVADGFGYVRSGAFELSQPFLRDPHLRMNDAKCDSAGRMWAGSTDMSFRRGDGALHVWDGRSSRMAASGFSLPNGMGWSPDDSVMYLVDSTEHRLLSAPFDPTEGTVGSFELLTVVPEGLPDGLAVASDGTIWVAVWGASSIQRFSANGHRLQTIGVPVSQPTSCAFGDDGELFITTARAGLTPAELAEQPLAGSILRYQTDTTGTFVRSFATHG